MATLFDAEWPYTAILVVSYTVSRSFISSINLDFSTKKFDVLQLIISNSPKNFIFQLTKLASTILYRVGNSKRCGIAATRSTEFISQVGTYFICSFTLL